jgi:hypothetical protein
MSPVEAYVDLRWTTQQVYRPKNAFSKLMALSGKKSTSPQPMRVGTHHPQPMKMDFIPTELSKTGQIILNHWKIIKWKINCVGLQISSSTQWT